MTYRVSRDELSVQNRLRRSHYEVLRDEMDQYVLDYALTGSYKAFKAAGNLRYFLLSVFRIFATTHHLHVVNNDQTQLNLRC